MNLGMKKTISLTLLTCFLTTNMAQGFSGAGIEILSQKAETPGSLQIEVPNDLASIEEAYEAPARLDPKLILHIQNAHGNYEAQSQIKKLLKYLQQTYGFNLLFLEGAVEKLDPNYLNFFPEPENNLKLAEHLAKKGELTGAELYLVDAPSEVEAIGIEQAELYRANFEAFKKVHASKTEVNRFLEGLKAQLETFASGFFNPETRKLVSEWQKFEAGHREFLPFVRALADEARSVLDLDLDNMFSQVEWPQITRLLVLQSMESELQREQALKEKTLLLAFLKKISASEKLIQGIEKLEDKRIGMNRMSPEGADQENLPRYLLERLVEEAGPKGFYFHEYPAFSLYAGYLILQSELESKVLFEEIARLFEKILNELTPTEREKNLLELFRDAELLKKLFHLELTRKEWGRASYRKDWILPGAILKRVEELSEEKKSPLTPTLSPEGRGQSATERDGSAVKFGGGEGVASIFNTAFRFYELARQRESVFYYTMKQEMFKRKENKAILVTGGFHTEGLMEMFREEQVNYGVLTPRLNERIEEANYVGAMLQNRPTIFDLANLEAVLNMQRSGSRAVQGMKIRPGAESVMDSFLEVLKGAVKNRAELREALKYFDEQSLYAKDNGIRFSPMSSREANEDSYLLKLPKGKPEAYQIIFRENHEGISLHLKRGNKIDPSLSPNAGATFFDGDQDKYPGNERLKLTQKQTTSHTSHLQTLSFPSDGHTNQPNKKSIANVIKPGNRYFESGEKKPAATTVTLDKSIKDFATSDLLAFENSFMSAFQAPASSPIGSIKSEILNLININIKNKNIKINHSEVRSEAIKEESGRRRLSAEILAENTKLRELGFGQVRGPLRKEKQEYRAWLQDQFHKKLGQANLSTAPRLLSQNRERTVEIFVNSLIRMKEGSMQRLERDGFLPGIHTFEVLEGQVRDFDVSLFVQKLIEFLTHYDEAKIPEKTQEKLLGGMIPYEYIGDLMERFEIERGLAQYAAVHNASDPDGFLEKVLENVPRLMDAYGATRSEAQQAATFYPTNPDDYFKSGGANTSDSARAEVRNQGVRKLEAIPSDVLLTQKDAFVLRLLFEEFGMKNALDAVAPDEGSVKVAMQYHKDKKVIRVAFQDNGPGMLMRDSGKGKDKKYGFLTVAQTLYGMLDPKLEKRDPLDSAGLTLREAIQNEAREGVEDPIEAKKRAVAALRFNRKLFKSFIDHPTLENLSRLLFESNSGVPITTKVDESGKLTVQEGLEAWGGRGHSLLGKYMRNNQGSGQIVFSDPKRGHRVEFVYPLTPVSDAQPAKISLRDAIAEQVKLLKKHAKNQKQNKRFIFEIKSVSELGMTSSLPLSRSEVRAPLRFKPYDLDKIDAQSLKARFRVIAISRGLLEPKLAEAAEIESVASVLSELDETAALKRFRALLSSHALFGPPAAPALAVIGTDKIPSMETLEANADLLAHSGRAQALIYVVVANNAVSALEIRNIKEQVKQLQGKKDFQGREIGERFNVIFTNHAFAPIAFQKAAQKSASLVARESEGKDNLDPLTIQSEHTVVLLEKSLHEKLGIDKDRFNGHLLLSDSFDHPDQTVIRDLVVRLYAKLKGDAEKLNQELKDIVIVKEGEGYEIVSGSLDALTAKVWTMIQSARAELRTKASA